MSTPLRPARTLEAAARRTRARRVVAFAGMLTTIGGLVGLRAHLAPDPGQALGSSGLAAQVGAKGHSSGAGHHHRHAAGARQPHRKAKPSRGSAQQVLVGNAYDVSYGTVQVKVTVHGHRIVDVTPLSLPQGGRSSDISSFAAPQLRQEALSAQSAHIDTVSGASYTSAGYAKSLQSALDKLGG